MGSRKMLSFCLKEDSVQGYSQFESSRGNDWVHTRSAEHTWKGQTAPRVLPFFYEFVVRDQRLESRFKQKGREFFMEKVRSELRAVDR